MTNRLEVRFRFRTEEEKEFFLGQLSDGWGENFVDMKWEGDMDDAEVIDIDPTVNDVWEYEHRNKPTV